MPIFCIFAREMAKLLKLNVLKEITVDWAENFGEMNDHSIFLARSFDSPIQFANQLSHLFNCHFSFLENFFPSKKQPNRFFSVFVAQIQRMGEVNLTIVANRMPIPVEELTESQPLLGIPLFDEYYYFFDDAKKAIFKCPFKQFDFILMLSCNKNTDLREIMNTLSSIHGIDLQDVSNYLNDEAVSTAEKDQNKFVKSMFYTFEVATQEKFHQNLLDKLGDVRTIPEKNYRFGLCQRDLTPTSPLIDREDI